MIHEDRLKALAQAVGTDIKNLQSQTSGSAPPAIDGGTPESANPSDGYVLDGGAP